MKSNKSLLELIPFRATKPLGHQPEGFTFSTYFFKCSLLSGLVKKVTESHVNVTKKVRIINFKG